MSASRFDELTKELSAAKSRRQALRILAAGVVGTVLARSGGGEASAQEAPGRCKLAGQQCREDAECCNRFCRNGRCACPPPFVQQGRRCVCPTGQACPPGVEQFCCPENSRCCNFFGSGSYGCCFDGDSCDQICL